MPERLDLHRLAAARGDDEAVDLGIHPGQLLPRLARGEEAVDVGADAEAGSPKVTLDDLDEKRVDVTEEGLVAGRLVIRAHRLDEPERPVDVVVLGLGPLVGEAVGDHAAVDVPGKGLEDRLGDVEPARGEEKAGEGDHRVAPPVGEPGVAGDDGPPFAALHDESIGGRAQETQESTVGAGPFDAPAAFLLGGAECRCVGRRAVPERRDERRLGAGGKVPREGEGREEILGELEAAFAVEVVLETAVPEERLRDRLRVVSQAQVGEIDARVKTDHSVFPPDGRVARRGGAAQLVVAAVDEKRPDLEADRSRGLGLSAPSRRRRFPPRGRGKTSSSASRPRPRTPRSGTGLPGRRAGGGRPGGGAGPRTG